MSDPFDDDLVAEKLWHEFHCEQDWGPTEEEDEEEDDE